MPVQNTDSTQPLTQRVQNKQRVRVHQYHQSMMLDVLMPDLTKMSGYALDLVTLLFCL